MKGTYSVEPEFGERCIVKLKEPFADGDFADITATLFFIPLSGGCIISVLKQECKVFVSAYHFSLVTKEGIKTASVRTLPDFVSSSLSFPCSLPSGA